MSDAQSVTEMKNALSAMAERNGEDKSRLLAAAAYLEEYAAILRTAEETAAKPQNGNTRWTEEEERQLAAEHARGLSVAELCVRHARTASGIVSRLQKMNLLREDDSNGKKRWTDKEELQLVAEYDAAMPLEEMAARHKRSMSGILGRLSKLSLTE
ncbi:MAG: hypothetical protein DBX59_04405 [Bacillota bacterium]|nr:MAG: hypothetical protein DBX59_04405 [Bacillota bacterium]